MKAKAKTVDEYLALIGTEQRTALERLRRQIRSAAPGAEEIISYGIPAYKYHGPLVFFAAFRNHCSLFAVSKAILKRFSSELDPFKTATTTIHFSPEEPLPASLVRKITKARMKENKDRVARKSKR